MLSASWKISCRDLKASDTEESIDLFSGCFFYYDKQDVFTVNALTPRYHSFIHLFINHLFNDPSFRLRQFDMSWERDK